MLLNLIGGPHDGRQLDWPGEKPPRQMHVPAMDVPLGPLGEISQSVYARIGDSFNYQFTRNDGYHSTSNLPCVMTIRMSGGEHLENGDKPEGQSRD